MKENIVNPNKESRCTYLGISILGCGYFLGVYIMRPDIVWALLGCVLVIVALVFSLANLPYVILSSEGVAVRFLLEKKVLYRWDELLQAGIIRTNAKRGSIEYVFPIVLLLPGGSVRNPEKDDNYLERNRFHKIVLPNKKEIREYVQTYYGPLDFNDIDKLNDWEKKAYKFD